jgi:phosphate transport system substrate-binding protein
MVQNKRLSPRQFGWVCALVASATPLTTSFNGLSTAALAQSIGIQSAVASTDMAIEKGTKVRIHSSNSMLLMNGALKKKFATQFPGSSVDVSQVSATKALEDVLNGQADVAAIGRPLTDQEKAQGLVASLIGRDKIAVVVNPQNPFTKDLTIPKFAQMFRGDITDWSQLGGAKGEITFVDRTNSDTRQALAGYPAFKNAPLESGKNAIKLEDTSMKALISSLKGSAVSFVPANQARTQDKLRTLTMNGVLPTSPLYPFSQPLYYVHKSDANGGMSNPVKAFLGFLATEVGQSTIRQSGIAQVQKPSPENVVAIVPGEKAAKMEAGGSKVSGTEASPATGEPSGIGTKTGASKAANSNDRLSAETDGNLFGLPFPGWLKWLLPLGLLGMGLLLLLLPNKRDNANTMVRGGDDDRNDSGFGPSLDTPLAGDGDRAKNAASNTTEILGNTTNTGDTALVGGAAAIGGLTAGAAANLRGDGDNWNENDGAPYIRDETDVNLADRATLPTSDVAAWEFLEGNRTDANDGAEAVQDAATTKLSKIKPNLDAPNITVPPVDGPGDFSLDQDWSFDDNTPDLPITGSEFVDPLKEGASNRTGDRSSIVIAPQNSREAVVRWQLTEAQKRDAKQQGGKDFALRLYDVTGINPESEVLENFYQYDCNELSQELRIEVPVPSRDYVVEVGYADRASEWYGIARSNSVHIPSA